MPPASYPANWRVFCLGMAGRRSNGEGTFYQRPNGRWEGRVQVTDPTTGKARRVTVSGRTKAEARAKLREVTNRVAAGQPPTDATATVGEWLAHWRDTALRASSRRPATKATYTASIDGHLVPAPFGDIRLDRLRAHHVEALIATLRDDRGLADSTVRSAYAVLKMALDGAVRDGLLAANPCELATRPKVAPREARYLTADEMKRLLAAARSSRYFPAIALIAGTGIRRGEALGLHWADVDLKAGTARVKATTTKTAAGRRTVRLAPAVVAELKAWKAEQNRERLRAGDQWQDKAGLLFTTELGTAVDGRNLLRVVERAAATAKLESVGVHTIRHSFATLLLEGGTHVRAVAEALGHADPALTLQVYTHASDRVIAGAVDGLADTLGL